MLTKKILISIAIAVTMLGCNSSSKSPSPTEQTERVTVSECKKNKTDETRSTYTNGIMTNDHTYIAYLYKEDKRRLTITHYNVVFNCDKRGIDAESSVDEDSITITERQNLPEGGGMYCKCLYDVTIVLNDIEAKKYILNYDDGISTDIHFEIDLAEETTGEKSFARTEYPYNQEVANGSNSDPLITKLIVDVVNADLPKSEYKLLKSQEEMDSTILGLKEIGVDKTDEFADILEKTSMDFTKEYLLIYTFKESCIYQYAETIDRSNNQEITIRLDKTREECDTAMIQHYLAYRVSKSVKSLKLDMLEQETITVIEGETE